MHEYIAGILLGFAAFGTTLPSGSSVTLDAQCFDGVCNLPVVRRIVRRPVANYGLPPGAVIVSERVIAPARPPQSQPNIPSQSKTELGDTTVGDAAGPNCECECYRRGFQAGYQAGREWSRDDG
jgi:hypothetical protein